MRIKEMKKEVIKELKNLSVFTRTHSDEQD